MSALCFSGQFKCSSKCFPSSGTVKSFNKSLHLLGTKTTFSLKVTGRNSQLKHQCEYFSSTASMTELFLQSGEHNVSFKVFYVPQRFLGVCLEFNLDGFVLYTNKAFSFWDSFLNVSCFYRGFCFYQQRWGSSLYVFVINRKSKVTMKSGGAHVTLAWWHWSVLVSFHDPELWSVFRPSCRFLADRLD